MTQIGTLRGDPSLLRQDRAHPEGYFGKLYNADDPDLHAVSLATDVFTVGGHMSMKIPIIVPTLSRQELIYLVDGGTPTWGIIEKAKRHAEQRLAKGLSTFAAQGEQQEIPST